MLKILARLPFPLTKLSLTGLWPPVVLSASYRLTMSLIELRLPWLPSGVREPLPCDPGDLDRTETKGGDKAHPALERASCMLCGLVVRVERPLHVP